MTDDELVKLPLLILQLAEARALKLLGGAFAVSTPFVLNKLKPTCCSATRSMLANLTCNQNLARFRIRRRLQQVDHGLGARLREAGGLLGLLRTGRVAGEHDRFALAGHLMSLPGRSRFI